MNEEKPLSVYRERLLTVQRELSLYRGHVAIQAHWRLGRRYGMSVELGRLRPKPQPVWIRQRIFRRAMALALLLAAAAVVLDLPRAGRPPKAVVWTVYGLAIAVGAVAARAWPKVLFIRFLSRDGKPGLDIARAGPDARRFDEFVDQVSKQISKA